jgi:hypothetical protein
MPLENLSSLLLNREKGKARYLALSHCWAETTKESLWTLATESIASLELELSQVFYLKLSITLLGTYELGTSAFCHRRTSTRRQPAVIIFNASCRSIRRLTCRFLECVLSELNRAKVPANCSYYHCLLWGGLKFGCSAGLFDELHWKPRYGDLVAMLVAHPFFECGVALIVVSTACRVFLVVKASVITTEHTTTAPA